MGSAYKEMVFGDLIHLRLACLLLGKRLDRLEYLIMGASDKNNITKDVLDCGSKDFEEWVGGMIDRKNKE